MNHSTRPRFRGFCFGLFLIACGLMDAVGMTVEEGVLLVVLCFFFGAWWDLRSNV